MKLHPIDNMRGVGCDDGSFSNQSVEVSSPQARRAESARPGRSLESDSCVRITSASVVTFEERL